MQLLWVNMGVVESRDHRAICRVNHFRIGTHAHPLSPVCRVVVVRLVASAKEIGEDDLAKQAIG